MQELNLMHQHWQQKLQQERNSEGLWDGQLASSALATATAVAALACLNNDKYTKLLQQARLWLANTQCDNGGWGDTPASPANLSTSLLVYAAIHREKELGSVLAKASQYLQESFGDLRPETIRQTILKKYGQDRSFSAPILAMCTAAGLFDDDPQAWDKIPRLPFELALLPERCYHFLGLPVVSYALPALLCVGMAQLRRQRQNGWLRAFRERLLPHALRLLQSKVPESGGFLEAAPLTAFCIICLQAAGLEPEKYLPKSILFLVNTVRPDGSWPIDSNLQQWLSNLTIKALAAHLPAAEKEKLRQQIRKQQFTERHPYTGARPGGWGWTKLSGAVPDADDSSAALLALFALAPGQDHASAQGACQWLLELQNRDGGIPTFCRGWGKLPFDRSCPDISAHAYRALQLWQPYLPPRLQRRCDRARRRILQYLVKHQQADGSFLPLWFGDQEAPGQQAPVYGTAVVLENLAGLENQLIERAKNYLLQAQLPSGAWGAASGQKPGIIFTARALSALTPFPDATAAIRAAWLFLLPYLEEKQVIKPEAIGLYFSQLWYSEKLYPNIFLLQALENLRSCPIGHLS